jgi:ABC-type uncharacterized transport system ATPase subunit
VSRKEADVKFSGAISLPRGIRIEVNGLCKRFGSLVANHDVTFDLAPGEILGLVGENGAGKSTCINMLFGHLRPDAGTIKVDGELVEFTSPRDAIALGIGLVHQHFQLAPALTVMDHLRLAGGEGVRARAMKIMATLGMALDLDARVDDIPVGQQQQLEILKVMCQGARAIILDEPTAVLTPLEVKPFLAQLRKMRESSQSVILISHKLDEVIQVSDRIAVMRGGTVVAILDPGKTSPREIAGLMMGDSHLQSAPSHANADQQLMAAVDFGGTALSLRGYRCCYPRITLEMDLDVRRGEIVGVAGVDGNGQQQLFESILRLQPSNLRESGVVEVDGKDISAWKAHHLRKRAKLALLPFDRHAQGMMADADLATNLLLSAQIRAQMSGSTYVSGLPLIQWRRLRDFAGQVSRKFGVVAGGWFAKLGSLSGGNQQKFVVAREFHDEPSLVLAAHPTRGVDVRSSQMIRDSISGIARRGAGVLLVSSDMDELQIVSDRIVVMMRGKVVAGFTKDADGSFDGAAIGRAMTGASPEDAKVLHV